jgi:putative endopeptidase
MKKTTVILLGASVITLIACDATKQVAKEIAIETSDVVLGQTFDPTYLNTAVLPKDDFFEFANGTWIKNNPVPASESRWGSFNELDKTNKIKLTKILDDAKAANGVKGSQDQILGDYYASFTDMTTRNRLGINVIEEELMAIEKMNSKKSLYSLIARQHILGVGTLFGFGVGQDLKDIDNNITYFGQGGMGLPNRDYYFSDSKKDILTKYEAHISAMIGMTEIAGGKNNEFAASVVKFETALAAASMAPAELRIPENTYHKMSRGDILARSKNFDFDGYLAALGSQSFDSLVISQPDFWDAMIVLVDETPLEDWKNYMTWKVLDHYAGHLDEAFVAKNFDFYGKVLSGKKEMKPLNERAIDEITGMEFSEMLGKAFVEIYYSESAQKRVNTMVDNLLIAFRERINNLDWMSPETKKEALNKLNSIGRKLGFPSKWEDFSSLKFTASGYVQNLNETARFAHKKNMLKLNDPVDKDKWGMPAHMVNAYYHPLMNEIAFPAGIMQAPFFSDAYEDAANYGRIGMVIGHEFTHGFDDMGSKFAADGSFKNWWTESDRKLFDERTSKLGATYSNFCPIDGHCVNSSLTMGENIADLGGLTLAYQAYTRTDEYKSGISKKGYTPAQRFFISYAQLWKINYTQEELKNRIANDPHSPGMYRVNGPLMNCPEFFEAFGIKEGDPMRNSAEKISKIW